MNLQAPFVKKITVEITPCKTFLHNLHGPLVTNFLLHF